MNTIQWTVDKNELKSSSYPHIQQAASLLQQDEVVAFPTETVYGLGANAYSDKAVTKIFQAKGRPSDNPLIVHISNKKQLTELVDNIPAHAEKLMDKCWPGPLTIIFSKKNNVSQYVTAGLDTIAIRMPDHPVALALIEESGLPLAAPSANLSGKPSPTTAKHVVDDLDGKIAGIVDGGQTGVGLESTVVDCTTEIPIILRPGGITKEQLEQVVGEVAVDPALASENIELKPKSPGMKYTHYAPIAPLYMVEGDVDYLQHLVDKSRSEGKIVGVLSTEEHIARLSADVVLSVGTRTDLATVAVNLYEKLRQFNETNVDIIYSESFPAVGVGAAIMNRLNKAAGYKVLKSE
ncbi:L-threonylcarbamoyladenylate synthase [Bacillus alkalisoli]|uniref:L-threonylcarbamoyladenylate synthase n=1 Tax=Bacillus alkalisoli TaxID=2011008 RepID=UPI000C240E0F|nr:L-threonylcarbamoyladenylate synthase [Bacillus alkalisoli]